MSNSDYIEELMFKAYDGGFFHRMHPKVDEIKREHKNNIELSDAYFKAYHALKEEHKQKEYIDHGDVDYEDGVDGSELEYKRSGQKHVDLMDDDSWDY